MERVFFWGKSADETYSRLIHERNKFPNECQWVEWSIHGFPWIVCSFLGLIFSYGRNWGETVQYFLLLVNLALYFDLIVVALIKFAVLRERPTKCYGQILEHTVDEYSFPSGHSSRACMLITILYSFSPNLAIALTPLPVIVGISRVALGRHYITDILAGVVIGYIEGLIILQTPLGFNTFVKSLLY